MNNRIDDESFENYLSRRTEVSDQYREAPVSEVPPEMDRSVLAQARNAIEKKQATSTSRRRAGKAQVWMRWSAPIALAASVVLVVSFVMESGVQLDAPERVNAVRQDATPDAAKSAKQEVPASAEDRGVSRDEARELSEEARQRVSDAPAAERLVVQDRSAFRSGIENQDSAAAKRSEQPGVQVPQAASASKVTGIETKITASPPPPIAVPAEQPPATAITMTTSMRPAPLPAPMSDSQRRVRSEQAIAVVEQQAEARYSEQDASSEQTVTANRRGAVPGQGAGPRGTVSSRSTASEPQQAGSDAQLRAEPQQWLASIRRLREQGNTREADRQWREFRQAYPDYEVELGDTARIPIPGD